MIVKQPKPSVYKKNAFSHKAMCITILRRNPPDQVYLGHQKLRCFLLNPSLLRRFIATKIFRFTVVGDTQEATKCCIYTDLFKKFAKIYPLYISGPRSLATSVIFLSSEMSVKSC